MKRSIILFSIMMAFATVAMAKDIKTVVFTTVPQMHCSGCENKIKNNIRFVKGVKSIETNVEKQTVTVQYDADKTSADKIRQGFSKIGYTAEEVKSDKKK